MVIDITKYKNIKELYDDIYNNEAMRKEFLLRTLEDPDFTFRDFLNQISDTDYNIDDILQLVYNEIKDYDMVNVTINTSVESLTVYTTKILHIDNVKCNAFKSDSVLKWLIEKSFNLKHTGVFFDIYTKKVVKEITFFMYIQPHRFITDLDKTVNKLDILYKLSKDMDGFIKRIENIDGEKAKDIYRKYFLDFYFSESVMKSIVHNFLSDNDVEFINGILSKDEMKDIIEKAIGYIREEFYEYLIGDDNI